MGRILFTHILMTIGFSVALGLLLDWRHASSFALGSALMGVNFWLLKQTWGRFIAKKSIALALGIIVIKWTLFLATCFYVARSQWVMPISFVIGIASVLVSAALVVAKSDKRS